MLHKVSIAGLTMDPASNTPIIILKSEEDDQAIPIWIGLLEATSIASALQNIKYERPMTHDLFIRLAVVLTCCPFCDAIGSSRPHRWMRSESDEQSNEVRGLLGCHAGQIRGLYYLFGLYTGRFCTGGFLSDMWDVIDQLCKAAYCDGC